MAQEIFKRIKLSDESGERCECYSLLDVYVQFADGSLKRPDISIFREKPVLAESALQVVPDVVVEVLSPGTGRKDLEVGPPFYLSQGVLDVVTSDPESW